MKINNKRELQNIAINHFADIDYQDFKKIIENVQKNHISNPLRFRRNYLILRI